MRLKCILAVAGLALAVSQSAFAATLNSTYTGATPVNTLSYDFTGTVLTLSMGAGDANEFITQWGFDIDGTLGTPTVVSSLGVVADPILVVPGDPSLGPLSFDISFGFQSSAGDGRFQGGESITINLPGVTSITSSGAHVQGIAAAPGSGKVTVPEPTSILGSLAALGMVVLGRKRLV